MSSNVPQIHPLFIHTVPAKPLDAELFVYIVTNGQFDLRARMLLSRDADGSVYLGICTHPAPFGEPRSTLSVAMIWDLKDKVFRLRSSGLPESSTPTNGGILGHPFSPVTFAEETVHQTHLGYDIKPVRNYPGILYSPMLELALSYDEITPEQAHRHWLVQSIRSGEADLSAFRL